MNEAYAWNQWWALSWHHAHPDWHCTLLPEHDQALARSQHVAASKRFCISPCLPSYPTAALLHWVLTPPEQHDLTLALVNHTCRPMLPTSLDPVQNLWCLRLAKALRPSNWLDESDDVLQLLRAWVGPAIWQRLRLRYPKGRVMAMERNPTFALSPVKLESLWHAAIWQAHDQNSAPPAPHTQAFDDVVTPQD